MGVAFPASAGQSRCPHLQWSLRRADIRIYSAIQVLFLGGSVSVFEIAL